MTSYVPQKISKIIDSLKKMKQTYIVRTVTANGLALPGARASTDTSTAK